MRNFTIATLAVFAQSAAALRIKRANTGTTNVGDSTAAQPDINWIGKYNFNGAKHELLNAMSLADLNSDGVVTIDEAITSSESIRNHDLPSWVGQELSSLPSDYDLRDDVYVQTLVGPMSFDADEDRRLSRDELDKYAASIGMPWITDDLLREHGKVDMGHMEAFVDGLRYGGPQRPSQTDGFSDFIKGIEDYNANGDEIVTLREYIDGINSRSNLNIPVEHYINKYGEGADWLHDDDLVVDLLVNGTEIGIYEEAYALFDKMGIPWVLDTYLQANENGITLNDMHKFVQATKYENVDDWMYMPADWVPLHLRLTAGFSDTFMQFWGQNDHTQDGVVTLRELLEGVKSSHDILDVERIISQYGEDYEWWNDQLLTAQIVLSKYDEEDDRQP